MSRNGDSSDSSIDNENSRWPIDRRSVLRSSAAASAFGLLGTSGFSGVAGARGQGGPCHKDFECQDGTYIKFEFVIEEDDEGNVVDCYFEEETETEAIEITYWESKVGEDCEPIYVEWESDTHVAMSVMAFGGDTCDEIDDPSGSYHADPAEREEGGLVNDGDNTAAISNLQFCAAEVEEIVGTINLSYEDLPVGSSDWDVNDWVVDLIGTYVAVGEDDGTPLVSEFTFDIVPQARGAGDDHEWRMVFPSDVLCGDGSYNLTVRDNNGTEIRNDVGAFGGGEDVTIVVFPHTEDVYGDLENAEVPGQTDGCVAPNEWASLTIEFDDVCAIDIPEGEEDIGTNGAGLFFDPVLENLAKSVVVHQGDERLVVVPEDWQWPLGAVQIWDAYDGVSEDNDGTPSYDEDDWYLADNITNGGWVTSCDFDPADLGGS